LAAALEQEQLSDPQEILFRQVHPSFLRDGRPSSQNQIALTLAQTLFTFHQQVSDTSFAWCSGTDRGSAPFHPAEPLATKLHRDSAVG
jgi:hypothetical protein